MRFDEIVFDGEFDGIWACASLLHVPRHDLPPSLEQMTKALKTDGAFYLSFKYGSGERMERGRLFTDMNEFAFDELLATQASARKYQA